MIHSMIFAFRKVYIVAFPRLEVRIDINVQLHFGLMFAEMKFKAGLIL